MTKAITERFSQFTLEISDENSPETFSAICALTSRGIQRGATVEETPVPDCADEDLPAATERDVSTTSVSVQASGLASKENFRKLRDWWASGLSKKARLHHWKGDTPSGLPTNAVGYEEGFFVLASLNETGERGQRVTIELELQSDGDILWTNAV